MKPGFDIKADSSKSDVFRLVKKYLDAKGFVITGFDDARPWGGFFVMDEKLAGKFIAEFFPGYDEKVLVLGNKLSPKILLVEPAKRLSWQYHNRRAEIWRVLHGDVEISVSDGDKETQIRIYSPGDIITIGRTQRHRLKGLDEWGIVAEIWQHTDIHHPSDENDIVRLEDDFGRG
jgi:mannose-6-phosphate isomerase